MNLRNYNKEELEVIKRYLENDLKEVEKAIQERKDDVIAMLLDGKDVKEQQWIRDDYKSLLFQRGIIRNRISDINYILNPDLHNRPCCECGCEG